MVRRFLFLMQVRIIFFLQGRHVLVHSPSSKSGTCGHGRFSIRNSTGGPQTTCQPRHLPNIHASGRLSRRTVTLALPAAGGARGRWALQASNRGACTEKRGSTFRQARTISIRCRGRLITFLGSVSAVGSVSVEIVVEDPCTRD